MKKVIVTTTINNVTKAIEKFQAMKDWELVVIGDKKTPKDYKLDRGIYVTPEEQEKYDPELSAVIGWNCIQRRSFGLLWANEMKADMVAVIDDDNIPYDSWGENLLIGKQNHVNFYQTKDVAFDPIGATNEKRLWHRGFPLQLLPTRDYALKALKNVECDIQADFWDGDPDIDAVCRLEHAPECKFDPQYFPIASNAIAPFNSQNTFISGRVLPHYFLFPHVGRMDDIWAAYYVQAKGYKVVFNKASVYQDRNIHDLIVDMKKEYFGYENNLQIVTKIVKDPDSLFEYLPGSSIRAFQLYRRHFDHA